MLLAFGIVCLSRISYKGLGFNQKGRSLLHYLKKVHIHLYIVSFMAFLTVLSLFGHIFFTSKEVIS